MSLLHSLSWVTVVWSMTASACLTLAAMHLLVWYKNRAAWASLAFAFAAMAVVGTAAGEFLIMRARAPEEIVALIRWTNVPLLVLVAALVGFVRLSFRTGRAWLGVAAVAPRLLGLILNFTAGANHDYREITALPRVVFLGEPVTVVSAAVVNPWAHLNELSTLFLLVFVADATIGLWRTGGPDNRRRALLVGGSILGFILVAAGVSALINREVIHAPYLISFPFLAIVLVMNYELSRDVLRAAQLSADLHESEERMTLAAEAAGLGIWIWSLLRNQIWGSESWLRLFGFSPNAAIDFQKFMQRIHRDDRERVEREVRRALEDRGDYAGEFRVTLPDGTLRWLAARGRMYLDAPGNPARMLGVAMDITGRKQSELELGQQRNELAHVARVSAMSQLASSLAHELNQPLGAILRNAEAAELLLQDPSPDLDEVRAILADIRKDDQRAGKVIDRMRALMQRREVERRLLDLNLLAGEVVTLVRPDAEIRRVRLALETDPALSPVDGDRVQLQQVLLNLLLNAMDAVNGSPPTERQVAVRARLAGAMVEVTVSDTGHGIPADQLLRVFEPFFTSKPNGLGMGLAISRGIIEAHGGRLWAENNADAGATFTFSLPVAKPQGGTA